MSAVTPLHKSLLGGDQNDRGVSCRLAGGMQEPVEGEHHCCYRGSSTGSAGTESGRILSKKVQKHTCRTCCICFVGFILFSCVYNYFAKASRYCVLKHTDGCSEFFGPTYCDTTQFFDKCECLPGYRWEHTTAIEENMLGVSLNEWFVAQKTCVLDPLSFNATTVKVDENHRTFPGGHGDVKTALAFSGGGSRAFSMTLGLLRGLHELNLMRNVDAISSVSGGTWAAGVYMFADGSDEYLLGPRTNPTELTMAKLAQENGKMSSVATTDDSYFRVGFMPGLHHRHHYRQYSKMWQDYVEDSILRPVGLDNLTFMAGSQRQVDEIKAANPGVDWSPYRFTVPQAGRPGVFVMSGAVLAPCLGPNQCYTSDQHNVYSLQMSPDFSGSPFRPNDSSVNYHANGWNGARDNLHHYRLGGGFVESFAFGTEGPMNPNLSDDSLREDGVVTELEAVHSPMVPFSLSKAMAISSCALAAMMNTYKVNNFVPRELLWPVGKTEEVFSVGDGGNFENSGLLAMLQRGARKIVWLISTDTGIDMDELGFCNSTVTMESKTAGKSLYSGRCTNQVYDKFGFTTQADTTNGILTNNQVFKSSDLNPLLCEFQTKIKAGRAPVVHRPSLQVQENKYWQIQGHPRTQYNIDIVFVYNARYGDFIDKLPAETSSKLAEGNLQYPFTHYPYFYTMNEVTMQPTAYLQEQVNLLASQTEYMVRENTEIFQRVLSRD